MGHELGGDRTVRVVVTQEAWNALAPRWAGLGDCKPEIILGKSGVVALDPRDDPAVAALNARPEPVLVTVADGAPLDPVHAFRLLACRVDPRHPVLLKDTLAPPADEAGSLAALLESARVIGSLLCDGIGDAVLVRGGTGPGRIGAAGVQHPAGGRRADFQDRLRRLPELRPHLVQPADRPPSGSARRPATSRGCGSP